MSRSAVISGIDGASRRSSVLGLNVSPSTAISLPRMLPPSAPDTLRAIPRVLHRRDRLDDAQRRGEILAGLDQRHRVLREARAAKTRAGMQELGADAVVEADAARDLLHIGAHLLAQVCDLVDEGDLG